MVRNARSRPAVLAAAARTRTSPRTMGSQKVRIAGSASDLTRISGLMPAASPMVMPIIGNDMLRVSFRWTSSFENAERARGRRTGTRGAPLQHGAIRGFDLVDDAPPAVFVLDRATGGCAELAATSGVA